MPGLRAQPNEKRGQNQATSTLKKKKKKRAAAQRKDLEGTLCSYRDQIERASRTESLQAIDAEIENLQQKCTAYTVVNRPELRGVLVTLERKLASLRAHKENLLGGVYKREFEITMQDFKKRVDRRLSQRRITSSTIARWAPVLEDGIQRAFTHVLSPEKAKAPSDKEITHNLDAYAKVIWNKHLDEPMRTPSVDMLNAGDESDCSVLLSHVACEIENLMEGQTQIPLTANDKELCARCSRTLEANAEQATMVCVGCGFSRQKIDATVAAMAYGEEVDIASFNYKKTQHANECIDLAQGKDSEISLAQIKLVFDWLWANDVRTREEINNECLLRAVKALKLTKLQDKLVQLRSRLTGFDPPRMTPDQEEWCLAMFSVILKPWQQHKIPRSRNFLSYPYCLWRFCALRGYWAFLPCFRLLKGRSNLDNQELVFKPISKDLDWEFRSIYDICKAQGLPSPITTS